MQTRLKRVAEVEPKNPLQERALGSPYLKPYSLKSCIHPSYRREQSLHGEPYELPSLVQDLSWLFDHSHLSESTTTTQMNICNDLIVLYTILFRWFYISKFLYHILVTENYSCFGEVLQRHQMILKYMYIINYNGDYLLSLSFNPGQ